MMNDGGGESAQPLPPQMRYSELLETAAPAVIQERRFSPSNGSEFAFDNAREIRIPISVSHGQFVDPLHSYMSFDVAIIHKDTASTPTAATLNISGGVESLIQDFSVIGSDGTILERIVDNNHIAAAMKAIRYHKTFAETTSPLTEGYHHTPNLGAKYTSIAGAAGDGAVATKTFTFNLSLSALLNSDKYLPLGFLSGSALTLSMTLAAPSQVLCVTAPASIPATKSITYSVRNAAYVASVLTYSPSVTNLFQSLLNEIGGVQISGHHIAQIGTNTLSSAATATAGNYTFSLPCRAKSTKALIHLIRDGGELLDLQKDCINSRRTRKVTSVQHSIGGIRYPIAPINLSVSDPSQLIQQIHKTFYSVGDSGQGGLLKLGDGDSTVQGAAGVMDFYPTNDVSCGFLIVQGFESAPGAAGLSSGLDLSQQSSNVDLQLTMTPSSTTSTQISSFVLRLATFTFTSAGTVLVST